MKNLNLTMLSTQILENLRDEIVASESYDADGRRESYFDPQSWGMQGIETLEDIDALLENIVRELSGRDMMEEYYTCDYGRMWL